MTTPTDPVKLMRFISSTLGLPEQNTTKLSFCDSHKLNKLKAWAEELKVTQAISTSILLYKSIPELSLLKTTYKTRLEMLETVRIRLKTISAGLAKEYLKKPIILPPEAQKAAIIAQAIQKHFLNGYLISLQDCLTSNKKNTKTTLDDIALIICRSMHAIQTMFFRSYQLYTRYPNGLWQTLHALYRIADHFDLLKTHIDDNSLTQNTSLNIEQVYARTLLLSASKPNQLSQSDVCALYESLENGCQYTRIQKTPPKNCTITLCVNTASDSGPFHRGKERIDSLVSINTNDLIAILDNTEDAPQKTKPVELSRFVKNHIINAWTQTAERADQRNATNTQADICIGLCDCHKLLTQGESFQNFISSEPVETGLEQTADMPFTPNTQFDNSTPSNIAVSGCTVINTSVSGYCLLLQGAIPTKMQAGEILLIRERSRSKWKLGVVRWIKQLKNASQIGVQVIAHNPIPAAIRKVSTKSQQPDYQRALLTHKKNTQTVLCPSNLFEANRKVSIIQNNKNNIVKVEQIIYSTSNITQYAYLDTVV